MISKELLSEVLEEEVLSVRPYISDDPFYKNVIMWEYRKNTYDTINIYELAHKCKVWANKNNYYVASGKYYENWDCEIFKISWDAKSWHEPEETFDAPTEPEAIFKTCQWILDNKES